MGTHCRCHCGHALPLADEASGREVECPGCGAPQFVPALAAIVAMSNARGQRVARLNFQTGLPEALPFLADDSAPLDGEEYEPPSFSPRRPR